MAQGLGGGRTQPENVVAIPDWESHIANIAEKVVQVRISSGAALVCCFIFPPAS